MRFAIFFFLTAVFTVIRSQSVSERKTDESDSRFLLSTFTIVISTVTSTSTIGTTTTCTTSSSAMNACSAIGRRRRGILLNDDDKLGRIRRGLFYDDDHIEENEASIPSAEEIRKIRSAEFSKGSSEPSSLTVDHTNVIPLTIQSGFSIPEGVFTGTPRFKLAYGTSTVITTMTSTATRSLFIFCNSITNYQTCGSGK